MRHHHASRVLSQFNLDSQLRRSYKKTVVAKEANRLVADFSFNTKTGFTPGARRNYGNGTSKMGATSPASGGACFFSPRLWRGLHFLSPPLVGLAFSVPAFNGIV